MTIRRVSWKVTPDAELVILPVHWQEMTIQNKSRRFLMLNKGVLESGKTRRILRGTTHNHAETFRNTCVITSPHFPVKYRAGWVMLLTSPPSGKRI